MSAAALVLAIAVDALGAAKVRAVMMPSPYTANMSWIDAREMANRLGVRYDEIAIAPSRRTRDQAEVSTAWNIVGRQAEASRTSCVMSALRNNMRLLSQQV